jgi:hypothetical protein
VPKSTPYVFRWDLDKTYLISHFESLRKLLAVPFERGQDKVAVPGVTAVLNSLRADAKARGHPPQVYFLSASPPQIGAAIREKLAIDGIEYDGITFKDQVGHIVRGRFDALREQIGYKLERLLVSARTIDSGAREFLFGDDWESDPYVYSLYADLLAGRIAPATLKAVLERAGVHRHYVGRIEPHLAWIEEAPRHVVAGIFILRQRRVLPVELEALGPRLAWFDNYLECALCLYARGLVSVDSVVDVARGSQLSRRAIGASFAAAAVRQGMDRGYLEAPRKALVGAGLMNPTAPGRLHKRFASAARRALGRAPMPRPRDSAVPDYVTIVDTWSHRRRKERR